MLAGALCQRRKLIEVNRERILTGELKPALAGIDRTITDSWQRSNGSLFSRPGPAPMDEPYATEHQWRESLLNKATRAERQELDRLVFEGDMVAAIADAGGRLLWTSASDHMRPRAESVNFCSGGIWHESVVGTNAVGLALAIGRPVTVFSSEHVMSNVHDWVCYAAPIVHPQTGECLGVLDMSTTWEHYTPMGQSAVAGIACSIAARLPAEIPRAELEIHALGRPRVHFRGRPMSVTPRQLELLCLLSLNPQGLSLNELHASLYGDLDVSLSTLKAELSRLRKLLSGGIGSRPYRLQLPVWADFLKLWQALEDGRQDEALSLYRGPLLPRSEAPELMEWRHCIDALIERNLADFNEPSVLLGKLRHTAGDRTLLRERLGELLN